MAEPARNISKAQPLNAREADRAPAQKSVAREYVEAMIIALVLAVFIRTFFVQAYKIPSGSMEPTLLIGDHILVNKIIFGLRMPDSIFGLEIPGLPLGQYVFHLEPVHRGDVVVFVFPPDRTKDFIKRVIGTAGDTVAVKNGVVWLNGSPMDDPHAHREVAEHGSLARLAARQLRTRDRPAGQALHDGRQSRSQLRQPLLGLRRSQRRRRTRHDHLPALE